MNIEIKRVKIVVTVPNKNLDTIRNVMCEAGAGIIGNYSYCSNSGKIIGTFKPNEKANPYIGSKNELEFVDEEKLEIACDIEKVKKVISALRKAHPYEEPAIDIIPLIDENDFQ